MAIHHAILKRAAKLNIVLTDNGNGFTAAHSTFELRGPEAKYLLDDCAAILEMAASYASFKYQILEDDTVTIEVRGTDISVHSLRAAAAFKVAKQAWIESRADLDEDDEEADIETQAEIEAEIEEDEEARSGNVVKAHYRAKYAEAGHPAHCGDWLANLLNGECLNAAGFNLDIFDEICVLNAVNLDKLNRTNRGWQGRLRMTGRNMLAKRVATEGAIRLPGDRYETAAPEWLASRPVGKKTIAA